MMHNWFSAFCTNWCVVYRAEKQGHSLRQVTGALSRRFWTEPVIPLNIVGQPRVTPNQICWVTQGLLKSSYTTERLYKNHKKNPTDQSLKNIYKDCEKKLNKIGKVAKFALKNWLD